VPSLRDTKFFFKQSAAGIAECGVVRQALKPDKPPHSWPVLESLYDAAIVLFHKVLKREDGEELWLSELVGAFEVRVWGHLFSGYFQGCFYKVCRRSGHFWHDLSLPLLSSP